MGGYRWGVPLRKMESAVGFCAEAGVGVPITAEPAFAGVGEVAEWPIVQYWKSDQAMLKNACNSVFSGLKRNL